MVCETITTYTHVIQFAHAWNRTKNLQLRRLLLYPIELHEQNNLDPKGFEPLTSCVQSRRSSQLS